MIDSPTRPVLRYFGGKWRLAPWVISYFPPHRVYIEPYGGAASILMQKKRSHAEIYNDIDSEIVNVFKVLQKKEDAWELERLVRLTPYSRDEFETAYLQSDDPIEQARRTIIKAFMGHGSDSIHKKKPSDNGMFTRITTYKPSTGFRANSNRSGVTPANDWRNYPGQIAAFVKRLQGVIIENRPAIKIIESYDKPDALIYVDPPYLMDTRKRKDHGYRFELTKRDHCELSESLHSVKGMVIISGYQCPLYDELYPDWQKYKCKVRTFGTSSGAIEVLWVSPKVPLNHQLLF